LVLNGFIGTRMTRMTRIFADFIIDFFEISVNPRHLRHPRSIVYD